MKRPSTGTIPPGSGDATPKEGGDEEPPSQGTSSLHVQLLPQPTDTVCGPTCLHAVYSYFGDTVELGKVIDEVASLPQGGTLAVQLGYHALKRGYRATIYTNNLQTFDPTWFRPGVDLSERLLLQHAVKKHDKKLSLATEWYLRYLNEGGEVRLENFTPDLLRSFLERKVPILAGLSATYLYGCPRERDDGTYDDIGGSPTGHFVLIQGYDQDNEHLIVADPLPDNPGPGRQHYSVELPRLLAAIHLGIVTYDANLLIIEPSEPSDSAEPSDPAEPSSPLSP
jgi:hypothetical protein